MEGSHFIVVHSHSGETPRDKVWMHTAQLLLPNGPKEINSTLHRWMIKSVYSVRYCVWVGLPIWSVIIDVCFVGGRQLATCPGSSVYGCHVFCVYNATIPTTTPAPLPPPPTHPRPRPPKGVGLLTPCLTPCKINLHFPAPPRAWLVTMATATNVFHHPTQAGLFSCPLILDKCEKSHLPSMLAWQREI